MDIQFLEHPPREPGDDPGLEKAFEILLNQLPPDDRKAVLYCFDIEPEHPKYHKSCQRAYDICIKNKVNPRNRAVLFLKMGADLFKP